MNKLPRFLDSEINCFVSDSMGRLAVGLACWLGNLDEVRAVGLRNRELAAEHVWPQMVERYLDV